MGRLGCHPHVIHRRSGGSSQGSSTPPSCSSSKSRRIATKLLVEYHLIILGEQSTWIKWLRNAEWCFEVTVSFSTKDSSSGTLKSDLIRRGSPEQALLDEELTEYRSLVGCFQWICGASRPDLSASVSLLRSGDPTRAQLRALQQTALYAQQTEEVGITFIPVPLEQLLVGYGDANAPDKKSQLGLLVVATAADALLPGKVASA
eukprot:5386984-Amphidinium_carterae.1